MAWQTHATPTTMSEKVKIRIRHTQSLPVSIHFFFACTVTQLLSSDTGITFHIYSMCNGISSIFGIIPIIWSIRIMEYTIKTLHFFMVNTVSITSRPLLRNACQENRFDLQFSRNFHAYLIHKPAHTHRHTNIWQSLLTWRPPHRFTEHLLIGGMLVTVISLNEMLSAPPSSSVGSDAKKAHHCCTKHKLKLRQADGNATCIAYIA